MTTHDREPNTGSHANHDRLLIAGHAAGDLVGRDVERAEALLADCDACRSLRAELRAIASATRTLPPRTVPAGRDFRITADRAAALTRGGWWRRILRPFGRPSGSSVRPLALTLTTLGFAGLVLASLPSFPLGSGAAAPAGAPNPTDSRTLVLPSQVPEAYLPDATSGEGEPRTTRTFGPAASGGGGATDSGGDTSGAGQAFGGLHSPTPAVDKSVAESSDLGGEPTGPSPLLLLSVGFLGAGLGLLLLRLAALRLR
jgi:hypothetical protein